VSPESIELDVGRGTRIGKRGARYLLASRGILARGSYNWKLFAQVNRF
jgi:hypothetical protein